MNGLVSFRLCTLTDEELIKKIDEQTDNMFRSQQVPVRHIPAQPNNDYDLLVGELIMRFNERKEPRSTLFSKVYTKEECGKIKEDTFPNKEEIIKTLNKKGLIDD